MTSRLLHTLALLLQLLLLLTPASDAVYYPYYSYYSYYSYSGYYSYAYTFTCSAGCIVGAVIGGLTFIGGVIGLVVFLCCFCKAAKTRRVVPNHSVVAVSATSGRSPNATNGSYPMQPQPPPYDQNQMYPPADTAYPPPAYPQAGSAASAYPKSDDTAYPPPPAYSSAGQR